MRIQHVSVDEGYTRWAADYDDYENPLIAVEEPAVRELCAPVSGKKVLDAACGTGRHALWLHAAGARVTGIDQNAAMLALARSKCPELELVQGSVLSLPEELGRFDIVLNALMAEHVLDLGALVRSLASVLAPGGSLVLSVWHPAMVLKGVPTHYEDDRSGIEYVLPTHRHQVSDYFDALKASRLTPDALVEPLADRALIDRMPHMHKHSGWPLALVLRATRSS